ncbi:MAG: hypothetical protein H6719_03510 [Sandaracinaceae bacterium]|nr:hypothetical protein [Sandaracinaceae bacterium]
MLAPDDACTFTASGAVRTIGYLDVGIPGNHYDAFLLYQNQLLNLSRNGVTGFPVMADPNVMQVEAVEVEIRDIGNNPLGFTGPNPFTIPSGGSAVPSGDGDAAGVGIGSAQLVPPAYVAELGAVAGDDATIVISVKAIGHTAGGAEVVSDEFIYPIQLCRDCLSTCLTDDMGENICLPACQPGQDDLHVACDATCRAGTT